MVYYNVTYSKKQTDGRWRMYNDRVMLAKNLGNILSGQTKLVYIVHKAILNK